MAIQLIDGGYEIIENMYYFLPLIPGTGPWNAYIVSVIWALGCSVVLIFIFWPHLWCNSKTLLKASDKSPRKIFFSKEVTLGDYLASSRGKSMQLWSLRVVGSRFMLGLEPTGKKKKANEVTLGGLWMAPDGSLVTRTTKPRLEGWNFQPHPLSSRGGRRAWNGINNWSCLHEQASIKSQRYSVQRAFLVCRSIHV